MRIKNILATIVLAATGAMGIQAQEYLNYYGYKGNGYIPLDEIESITIGVDTTEITSQLSRDSRATIYYKALQVTGLESLISSYFFDDSYDANAYGYYYYTSNIGRNVATVPDYKAQGYTLFVTPDLVLNDKYGIHNLEDLAAKAKSIYDQTYPADAGLYDQDYTHPKNPLNRFMRYTVLKCDVKDLDRLTGLMLHQGVVQGVLGVKTDLANPTDWYQTLLPNTLMKCEQLTMSQYVGNGTKEDFYINRRYDANFQIEGTHISRATSAAGFNGHCYYVDDLVALTPEVRDIVQNTRIRMDFSTVFPELTTLDIRQNGDPTKDDDMNKVDFNFVNGRNYIFPEGYLDGLTWIRDCHFVYCRPHWNFWYYQGDEFRIFGNYDIEFRLPPVPYSGEWQVRLGVCALPTRGIAQIHFDGVPQGEPIDFGLYLTDESILGRNFNSYQNMTDEEIIAEQKLLKAKGYYRAPWSAYFTTGNSINHFTTNANTYRRVVCQTYIDNTQEHYLRIQCVSEKGAKEFSLDYIELVPKSFYDVPEGEMEDDL